MIRLRSHSSTAPASRTLAPIALGALCSVLALAFGCSGDDKTPSEQRATGGTSGGSGGSGASGGNATGGNATGGTAAGGSGGGAMGGEAGAGTGGAGTESGGTGGTAATPIELGNVTVSTAALIDPHGSTQIPCGENQVVLGGGCDCGPAGVLRSAFGAGQSWECTCDAAPGSGNPQGYAICSDAPLKIHRVLREISDPTPTTASCPPGQIAVGGGIWCTDGVVAASSLAANGWNGTCLAEDYSSGFVFAQCVTGALMNSTKGGLDPKTAAATSPCDGGKRLVAGGCTCSGGAKLLASKPADSEAGWSCACGDLTSGLGGAGGASDGIEATVGTLCQNVP